MTPSPHSDHDRLLELLAERALVGLETDQQNELESLLQAQPDFDAECLDRTAGLLDWAVAAGDTEPLPQPVQDRILAGGRLGLQPRPSAGTGLETRPTKAALARTHDLAKPSHGRRMHRCEVVAWLAAAACLLVAVFTWYTRPTPAPPLKSPTVANIEPPITTPGTDTPDPPTATLTVAQSARATAGLGSRCAAFATGEQRQRCGCQEARRRYCLEQRTADGLPASAGTGERRRRRNVSISSGLSGAMHRATRSSMAACFLWIGTQAN